MANSTLNLKLLFWTATALVLFWTTAVAVHAVQVRRHARNLAGQALRAEEEGRLDRAALYWSRCLTFAPQDSEALVHYGLALGRLAHSARTRGHALAILREALARNPKRRDLRRQAVTVAMDLEQFAEAREHLEVLLEESADRGEWEGLLARCESAQGNAARANETWKEAIRYAPGRVDYYVERAELLEQKLGRPGQAREVMDDLVRSNPKAPAAYLARAQYRCNHGSPEEAAQDLRQARTLAPTDVAVLVASAEVARTRGLPAEAAEDYRAALRVEQRNAGLYVALAEVEEEAGRQREAVECLRSGLEKLPGQRDLLLTLAEVLTRQGALEDARRVIARVRARAGLRVLADYLEACVQARQGESRAATGILEGVDLDGVPGWLAGRIQVCLAGCYGELGYPDRQLAALEQAVSRDPSSVRARVLLGALLVEKDRDDEAVSNYRTLEKLPGAPEECQTQLARALLRWNQRLTSRERDWSEVERALSRAECVPSQRGAVAVVRAELLRARGDPDQARAVLEEARRLEPGRGELWAALADLAARQGQTEEAARIIEEGRRQVADGVAWRLTQADFWARRGGPEAARALERLARGLGDFPAGDRVRVLYHLAKTQYRLGHGPEVERLCKRVLELRPTDVPSWMLLFDVTLQTRQDDVVRRVLAGFQLAEGEKEGTSWRWAEAARLVACGQRGDRSGLARARTLLAEVARQRPAWARVPFLEAQLDELEGRADSALAGYLKAIVLGNRQPGVVARAVGMLAERGLRAEADRVLQYVQPQLSEDRSFLRLAAEAALSAGNLERALDLARRAVPAESRDYRELVWLGRLLAALRHRDEAEDVLRRAAQAGEGVAEAWLPLVAYLAESKRTAEGEEVLGEMRRHLPPGQVALALAQGYEELGKWDRAAEEYAVAVAQHRRAGAVLLRAAAFHLRAGSPREAEPLLRGLLTSEVHLPEEGRRWARRQLALVLIEGGADRVEEARTLLAQNGPEGGETLADCLAQHIEGLLRQGKAEEARQWLARLEQVDPDSERTRALRQRVPDQRGQGKGTRKNGD